MPDDNVELVVEGFPYSGWKSIRITQSIESIAGSFAVEANDRWGDLDALGNLADPWPIAEGDPCKVRIGRTTVINGYVAARSLSGSKDSRTLSYTGKDRAAK